MGQLTCNFFSYTLLRAVDISVILPSPTFGESMRPDVTHKPFAKYPVLYLLHGGGNDYSTWMRYTSIERYAEERNIAVVLLSGENKGYRNWGEKDRFYDFISKELPEYVVNLFPISGRKEDTYIAGLSLGGYGTLIHALNRPDEFHAMGVLSPYIADVDVMFEAQRNPELATSENIRKNILPEITAALAKLRESGKNAPDAYVSCGTQETICYVEEFAEILKEHGSRVELSIRYPFGHEWELWDIEIRNFLNWIDRTDEYFKRSPLRKL